MNISHVYGLLGQQTIIPLNWNGEASNLTRIHTHHLYLTSNIAFKIKRKYVIRSDSSSKPAKRRVLQDNILNRTRLLHFIYFYNILFE